MDQENAAMVDHGSRKGIMRAALAIAFLLVSASSGSTSDIEPPIRDDEVRIDVRLPLAPGRSCEPLLAICRRYSDEIRGLNEREADGENPIEQEVYDAVSRRTARTLAAEIRKRAGTTAALSGKLLLAGFLTDPDTYPLALKLCREIQADCPGTWQATFARMEEARLVRLGGAGPDQPGRRKEDVAVEIVEEVLAAAVTEKSITPRDEVWSAYVPNGVSLRHYLLGELAHFLYWASERYDGAPKRERLERARDVLRTLRTECPALFARDRDLLSTIETLIERTGN